MFTLIRCRCRHQCSLVYLLPTGSLKTMTAVWIPVVVATLVVSVFASSPYNIVWGYLQQYYQRQSFQPPPPLLTWRPTPVVPLRPWDGRYHYLQTPPSSSWAAPLTAPKGEGHSTTGTCRSIRSLSTTHLLLGSPLNPHPLPYRRPDHGIASAVSADVDAMVTSGPTSSKSPHSPQHNLPHRLQLPCPFTPLKWQGDKEAPPLRGWGGGFNTASTTLATTTAVAVTIKLGVVVATTAAAVAVTASEYSAHGGRCPLMTFQWDGKFNGRPT